MKTKLIGIFICMLCIATAALPVVGRMEVNEIEIVKKSIGSKEKSFIDTSRTDWWPMFHHDLEHSGYTTSTGPDTNDILWSKELGWWVLSSPAVVDNKVYVNDATCNFYCLDAIDGSIMWSYFIGGGQGRTPAVSDSRVYFGAGIMYSATLYCLNAADGNHIWDYATNNHNIMSSPAIYNDKVYFGTMGQVEHDLEYYVYCLDAVGNGDGTTDMIWSYQLDDWVQSSPAVVDGKVYIGSHDFNIYCLDASDGSYIWSYTTDNYVRSSPAVVDGKVFIGSDDHNVYCLDASDGSYIWSYTTGSGVYSTPAVYDGKIYVGSFDNNVYCLDASDGSYIWSYTASDMVSTSPAIADGKVYVATYDGNIYCLDTTDGSFIWNYETDDQVWYSPSIADGKVYIGSKDHYVYCFGEFIPNEPPNPPTIDGPTNGKVGEFYDYEFTACIDPNGDDMTYHVEWGDGGTDEGFVASGGGFTLNHSWDTEGTFTIKAKLIDEHGAASDWAEYEVTITKKSRAIVFNSWLQWFLKHFPILQTLLQRFGLQ